jgi:hypothetical protein
MDRSLGSGTAVLRRLGANELHSLFRTNDGASVETTRTTVDPDTRRLVRRIRFQSAGVTSISTEVYEREWAVARAGPGPVHAC